MPYDKYSARFFGAANSGRGFVSFFDEIFGSLPRLYIIKGGPGTGKSRMMSELAAAAEERGHGVARIYCSADADSLDGVLINDLGVGVIDGTAPHLTDPKYPATVDEIVDIGRFLSRESLSPHRAELCRLTRQKAFLFARLYDLLCAAASADRAITLMNEQAITREKLSAAVTRISRSWRRGSGALRHTNLLSAHTMKGRVHFNSFAEKAGRIYTIGGRHGATDAFLKELVVAATAKAQPMIVAPDPLELSRISELMLPELDLAFVCDAGGKEVEKHINTDRFTDPALLRHFKPCLTAAKRLKREALDDADVILGEIASCHFKLEEIYSSAMDFKAKQALTCDLIKEILG